MSSVFSLKEQTVTDTPLLVFDCTLANGETEHWSTHQVTVGGNQYAALVMSHTIFEIQTASDQGVDGIPKISMVLANADSHFSEIERATGWKGARLMVGFLFYDLRNNTALTDVSVIFQGICNPPDEIREATIRLSATNRMSLQRLFLPEVRIERRCPWNFPATADQRAEAVDGGTSWQYSRYYRCGYSADQPGGSGNLDGTGAPFTSCDGTRASCKARGMFTNFGGLEFVPPVIAVRSYGEKGLHYSSLAVNEARYNDFVPMLYGTAWHNPPVVFARNDGNLTRMEVLLGIGEMTGVVTVLVNDIEIPQGIAGTDMTGTGWYNVMTLGTRSGALDPNFTDASGTPLGDPYGSMAYLSVVVPNRINNGNSLPTVQVLAQGLKLPVYAADGTLQGTEFTNNPAWILLDVLRRSGWQPEEIDVTSFAAAAAYCDQQISALDIYGNPVALARFGCNLLLTKRRSAGDMARGVRNTARMLLTYGPGGVLQVRVENSMALEAPSKPEWSNATEQLNGGWPSYEFGDGSTGISGILRKSTGEPAVRLYSRSTADTPNNYTVEFQDALNNYQQDSFSLVDPDDIARCGQEVTGSATALGLPNYDQAARILRLFLDKSIRGNVYLEFETSVKAFGVRPGDLIAVTYLKEGFTRQPFRILKIAPGMNHRVTTITAQVHDDAWYTDSSSSSPQGQRVGAAGLGVPRPLLGSTVDGGGAIQFGIQESAATATDGTVETSLDVQFVSPAVANPAGAGPGIPLVSLAAQVGTGGTLKGDQTLYYGVSAVDADGTESALSFLVAAAIAADGSSVTLGGLSFAPGTAAFDVYRGTTPMQLFRIATGQAVAATFTDNGAADQLIGPPDANYDHANFYWRMERMPEVAATVFDAATVGNGQLEMQADQYKGMTVRITRGRGAGQERAITTNTATVLTVAPKWDVEPDATSFFAVAENAWHFAAQAQASPVQFAVPNLAGEVVEITGRSANAYDVECPPEISIVTRWQIGGSGMGDSAAPPEPQFALGLGAREGTVELSGISFTGLTDTRSISAATLTVYYYDELLGLPGVTLSNAVAAGDTVLALSAAGNAVAGGYVQVDGEIMRVESTANNGTQYTVTRAMDGSTAAAHAAAATVYGLASKTLIAPFPPEFFGSPYAGSWVFPVTLPNVRVACAELFVTNGQGNSPVASLCLTANDDRGLRTLAGGQYCIQVNGFLAVDSAAAPALVIDATHAVGSVFAVLGTPADAPVNLQVNVNGSPWCELSFAAGAISSNSADGKSLAPLTKGASVTLSVTSVGQAIPGADLTVVIRV